MSGKIYDVIIVGAGLSGLQAAHGIQKAGLSCIVLEARNRVGGKTWSVPLASGKGVVDIGAAWTNDTNQSHVYALTKKFELELVQQNTNGDCIFQDEDGKTHAFPYGTSPKFATAEVEDLERIRDIIHDLSVVYHTKGKSDESYDHMSLEQFVISKGGSKKTVDMVKIWSRVMLGIESTDLSAQFFIEYNGKGGGLKTLRSDSKGGGQYLRFRKGTQSLSHGLASLLKPGTIHLSTPVTKISDYSNGVKATTKVGVTFTAKKLILSVPTPLYRDLIFSPPLTGAKLKITANTKLGYYSKLILCYSTPWWLIHTPTTQNCGLVISYQKPVGVIRDTSVPADAQFSLTCFISGSIGLAWSLLPAHDRRAQVLHQVSKIFGNAKEVYEPIEVFEQEWTKEEWSKGAPCPVTGPGVLTEAREGLSERVGNLHFVGTETSDVWAGYMEGAVRSGVRGAKEVVDCLGGTVDAKL